MTTSVVIDAGFAFKLLVPNVQRDQLKALVAQWVGDNYQLCAPTLWLYELTSILTKSVHFGTLEKQDAEAGLELAMALGVRQVASDDDQVRRAFVWTQRLGRAAAYDSFYLAAAESLGCDFWTVDRRLVHAANQPWVKATEMDEKRPD